ncbi:hypothetical protein MTO96_009076 [Rhipicephalus appendiculatus]
MSNIKVAVRVRPPIEREIKNGDKPIWKTRENTIYMESGKMNTFHTFDHVFDSSSTNLQVYQQYCHPIVESVMLGFNGTIFAFGQTASGKTHTMMGSSSQPGLIPLTIDAIFDIIQNMPEREFLVQISYIEIYNENVLDLLDKDYGKHLQIRDNVDGQPVISDLTEVTVGSKEEIMSVMKNGECRRHVASTEANPAKFPVPCDIQDDDFTQFSPVWMQVIESSLRDGTDGAVSVGQLNLVDLAGSERSEQCGELGERFRESSRINVSLSFLTQVISKLSRGERGHINFRDSKLTRILRNSLGGNAHTAIVCTVNPCSYEQTLSTLKFASSAKKIQNTPKVNEILTNEALIRRYHMQIEELKDQVKDMEAKNLTKALEEKNSQIDELRNQVSSLEKKLLKRKQRRETWAAPRSIGSVPGPQVCILPQWAPPPVPCMMVESPDMGRGRLSTVVEESESFHAISHDDFEKQLQREERIRRSAVLHTSDSSNTTCCSTTCAERIAFLENELKTLRKEHKELQELTTLERLMCRTSRRPVSSEKPDQVESTASDTQSESMHTCLLHITPEKADQIASTPLSRMNQCCIQTLLASRQQLERVSRRTSAFFSPVVTSPPLAQHEESSEASYTSPDCGNTGESIQGQRLHTPRALLWTPKHSPAVCLNGTHVGQSKTVGNQEVSDPLCFARATQTDNMPYLQASLQSIQTKDSHVSQQVQTPTVDAMCQTDSEDACEMPRPVTNELSENSVAERIVDGSTLVDVSCCAKTVMKSTGVQTMGSCCKILEGAPERPVLTDAAISCCLYSEQLVEYGIQTEPCQKEHAVEPTKQEAVCVPAFVSDQVPLVKSCFVQACGVQTCIVTKDSESQVNASLAEEYRTDFDTQTVMPSSTCCGVQAIPDTEDYASQVSTSLVEEYSKDFETQTVMPGSTCCGVQAIPDTEDYASQVSTSLVEEYRKDFETQTVMPGSTCCGVQAIPDTEDYASQVSTSLVEEYRKDFETQTVMPGSACCAVQAIPDVEDYASQVNKSLVEDYRTDFGVQVMAEVRSCASQVDLQLTRKEATHCAVQCELLLQNSERETPALNVVDCEVQATLLVQECATQTQQCLLHCDLKDSSVQATPSVQDSATQDERSRGDMSECSVQTTPRSFCDSSTQPDRRVPLASGCREVQDVPVTRSCVSEAKASAMSQDTSASKSSKSSLAKNGSSQFSAFSVRNILAGRPGSSVPPDVSLPFTPSGSTRRQQFGQPGGDILAALKASQRKFNEEEGRASLPAGHQKAADYTSPALLTAPFGTKTWLRHSETLKKSAAVQADIWNTQEMSLMEHRMDQYKKELQQRESEYKLQEKAAKKREIQLNAVIRQLKNKDKDLTVMTPCVSSTATATATSAGCEAPQPPGAAAAKALGTTESAASLAQRLKAMTPRSREGARLVHFVQSRKEQALAEEVQMAQRKASLSFKTQRLASAQRRQQAWAELSSHTAGAEPRSPLKEANQEIPQARSPKTPKDETLDNMEYIPPMKFIFDDLENLSSPL